MEKNTEILNELRSISPLLAEIPKVNIHSVPPGYFETLEEKVSIYSILNQEETTNTLMIEEAGIPAGYFENLPGLILSKVQVIEEKDEEDYSILFSLKDINVFKVPKSFFENLSTTILRNIKQNEKAKIISITSKTWWKYAAAALIAGIMLVSVLYFFNVGENNTSPYLAAAKQFQTPTQISAGIASLKDDEIIAYLETHGNITDNEIILKNIDTDALPTVVDYLIDDNTLNNYLNKIDIKNN